MRHQFSAGAVSGACDNRLVLRVFRAMSFAILFAGTGLLTFQLYVLLSHYGNGALQFVPGLPFAVACSFRFVRKRSRAFLVVLLDCIVWVIAFRIGASLAWKMPPLAALAIAGAVGGAGVTAAAGLYTPTSLVGAIVLGAITGSPFGLIPGHGQQENIILALSFPLWQIAIGLWIARGYATTKA